VKSVDLENVTVRFNAHTLFRNLTFRLALQHGGRPRAIALMGPSGSGKTTLANLMCGIEAGLSEGAVSTTPSDLAVAYVPQEPVFFPDMTVMQNARLFEKHGALASRFSSERFQAVAIELGLEKVLGRRTVDSLSGGERQRIMLLRTMSVSPDLIIFDEPTNGLDARVRIALLDLIGRMQSQFEVATILITHHWQDVLTFCDTVLYLARDRDGAFRIVERSGEDAESRPANLDMLYALFGANVRIVRASKEAGALVVRESGDNACFIATIDGPPYGRRIFGFDADEQFVGQLRLESQDAVQKFTILSEGAGK
jgi:ABC-type multidrug transport system ATPase subunit